MLIDILVAEIGSTTTLVNAFGGIGTDSPRFLGQGQAATSVLDGDVCVGLNAAVEDLRHKLGANNIECGKMLATSSAAGGLRMSVHGLVFDMTARAAEAAALGAGAVVTMVTAGKLSGYDIADITTHKPNLILLAGGTDYGERETALFNAKAIIQAGISVPVIYAGNVQNQSAIKDMFTRAGVPIRLAENVYPRLDELNIESSRLIIHELFEEHIVKAPGMERIRDSVQGTIMPTPGAVMEATRLLYQELGDVVTIDIGGATTDIHSASGGSDEIATMQTRPEPFFKRTVEGDLGLFVNANNLVNMVGEDNLTRELNIDVKQVMANYRPIPETADQLALTQRLCLAAGLTALQRHAGRLRHIYTPSGRQTIAEGKDLTQVKYIIGTGGALTRLNGRGRIMRSLADCNRDAMMLFPRSGELKTLFDNDYIMASLGVLSRECPDVAVKLLKNSLRID